MHEIMTIWHEDRIKTVYYNKGTNQRGHLRTEVVGECA